MFSGKTVLITGGTGSFGNAVLNHLMTTDVAEIRILSRDEKKQDDMRNAIPSDKIRYLIGDVRDIGGVLEAAKGCNFVFHAAALKQVPSCEFYPTEAIKTNVLGTENVIRASTQARVERLVVLSTDKAVYPINAMGMSKALAEKIMIATARLQSEGETVLTATRYGNVMASRGSVIPLFVSQIKSNQPITITDGAMTRFLMSLESSVELVLFAFANSNQGDIFIQKAPACTVRDLAVALKNIFQSKVPIREIGTRHGEKLFETLVSREEMAKAVDLGSYFRIPADNRGLNYASFFSVGEKQISQSEDYTSHNTTRLSIPEIEQTLLSLGYIQEQLDD